VGLLIFMGWKAMDWRKALRSLQYNAVYVVLLTIFPLFIQGQDLLEESFSDPGDETREIVYTNWIFSLSGGIIRVMQDRLNYNIITDFFAIVYAWLFSYLLYFAPLYLLARDDKLALRQYSIAMMFNYIILIPFYLLFPVSVSGSHPASGMIPLLYVDEHWGRMVTSVDPLNNDFPSGHVSLAITTLLIFRYAGAHYRRFYRFLIGVTAAVVFAVLYLGIHWPADVFAGFLVGVAAVIIARNEKVQMTIDRYVRALNDRIMPKRGTKKTTTVEKADGAETAAR